MAVRSFYNDTEPYVVEWLKNLIAAGLISPGDVSGASIKDLEAWQLIGYTRCHFFAGIAGWDYALKLAGWPEDLPVWTGSCPCQPFSVAGKRKGVDDERHLWPVFRELIRACKPPVVFGEQVASKDGRIWLAGVRADMEAMGYEFWAVDTCAAGVGAPHIRQRLYWVAYAVPAGWAERGAVTRGGSITRSSELSGVADSRRDEGRGIIQFSREGDGASKQPSVDPSGSGNTRGLVNTQSEQARLSGRTWGPRGADVSRLGNTNNKGSQGWLIRGDSTDQRIAGSASLGAWSNYDIIPCADGKARRVESGVFPLAHGVSARVGKLRAYGNAIVPQVAAEFIKTFMEVHGI